MVSGVLAVSASFAALGAMAEGLSGNVAAAVGFGCCAITFAILSLDKK